MRFYPRLNKTKASNVEYDHSTNRAYSYGHWLFYRADLKLFNNYFYSNSTKRHQIKIKQLLGHNDFIELNFTCLDLSRPVNAIVDELRLIEINIKELLRLINSPRTKKTTNELRLKKINNLIKTKDKLNELLLKLNKGE